MLNDKVGKVEKSEATVAQQQKQIETLTAQLREQAETQLKEEAAQIQKVSAQLAAGVRPVAGLKRASARRKWSTIPKSCVRVPRATLRTLR